MGLVDYLRNQYYWMKQTDTDAFTKYLRKKGAHIGDNVHFYTSNVDMRYIDKISIGDNVTISGSTLLAHDASTAKFLGKTKIGGVSIGSNVFIGWGSIILPNVTIGDNVIVGAGTVVRRDIPSGSVVIGNPAQIVCSAEEYLAKNRKRFEDGSSN